MKKKLNNLFFKNQWRDSPVLYDFQIINLLVGFFVVNSLPFFFGGDEEYYTDVYRVISLLPSLLIIFSHFQKKIKIESKFIFLFFTFYFFRMCYDFYVLEIDYDKNPYEYFATFFGVVAVPTISVAYIDFEKINWKKILYYIYILLFLVAIVNIGCVNFSLSSERSSGITNMWPMGFGQIGVTLSILSLFIYERLKNKYTKMTLVVGFFLGIIILVMSASKGPLVSLVIMLLLYFVLKGFPQIFKHILFLLITLGGILYICIMPELHLFTRLSDALNLDLSTLGRVDVLKFTLQNIKEHFFFGNSFLIHTEETPLVYPHNLFLEAFFSLGVFGGFLFLIINIFAILKIKNWKPQHLLWIYFIYIQYLVQSLFSWSLYTSSFFWISMMLVFCLAESNNHKKSIDK